MTLSVFTTVKIRHLFLEITALSICYLMLIGENVICQLLFVFISSFKMICFVSFILQVGRVNQ